MRRHFPVGSHCSGSVMPDYAIQEAVSSTLSSTTTFQGVRQMLCPPFLWSCHASSVADFQSHCGVVMGLVRFGGFWREKK